VGTVWDDNMNCSVSQSVTATTTAAAAVNYGTFGTTPRPRMSETPPTSSQVPVRGYEYKSDSDDDGDKEKGWSSGEEEEEGMVRRYKVNNDSPVIPRTVCAGMHQLLSPSPSLLSASSGTTMTKGAAGQMIPLTMLHIVSDSPTQQCQGVGNGDGDENGNSGVDDRVGRETGSVSPRNTADNNLSHSSETPEGEEGRNAILSVSSSLLGTTTVSFDENHKRNSVHLFVSDVNENEHSNETEETTRI